MCPVCREPMVAFELNGVEIDRCLSCGGTWLDAGELELLTQLAGAGGASDRLAHELARTPAGPRTTRRCPRCPRRLRSLEVGTPGRVVLDRCPRGHGLWFDRGEMEQVIRWYAGGTVARFFADLYQGEQGSAQGGK
ncbi:MAG: zf-TFIIB domain-containing protein [Acidobacteriota bacterium]